MYSDENTDHEHILHHCLIMTKERLLHFWSWGKGSKNEYVGFTWITPFSVHNWRQLPLSFQYRIKQF